MSQLTITLEGKKYQLKFGFGVFKLLGRIYGIKGYASLGKFINDLGFGTEADLTFDQLQFIGTVTFAAIQYKEGEEQDFDVDDIVDVLLNNPSMVEGIMTAFGDSLPKGDAEGKPNPATRKGRNSKK